MITCDVPGCVLPGRWRPIVASKAAMHWGEEIKPIDTGCSFCAVHKASATLATLFNVVARRALDSSFAKQGLPAIDWTRSELTWREVDLRDGNLLEPQAEMVHSKKEEQP